MVNEIINWDNVFLQSETFQKNKPFQYGFIKNFLNKEFYDILYNSYPKDDDSWITPKDFGRSAKKRWFGIADPNSDKCSLDVEDSSLNESWNKFFHYIHSKEFLENMSKFSNDKISELGEALKPYGSVNFQFRLDGTQVKVFEINSRFSGTTPLRAHAGFNEVELCLRRVLWDEPIIQPQIEEMIILRHWSETIIRKGHLINDNE